jgi:hypothetical protein
MKLTKTLTFLLIVLIASCQNKPKEKERNYVLITEDGISVEKFDSTNVDQNRFTENNSTFREGISFTYDFEHITTTDQKLLFTWIDNADHHERAWKFIPMDSINESTIKKVKITVKHGLEPFIKHIPDYNQTIIQYNYLTDNGNAPFSGSSGVIENENNIWMHPPRDRYFQILELNPFPFIKAPYEMGNQWEWNLTIGSGWSDVRWKVWEGQIENKYKYKITDKKKIQSALGEIECFVIESTAISRIGETSLTSYFNPEYGFVRLDYTNIDRSKTILELTKHSDEKTAGNTMYN